jgi:Poly A polymerase head domain/Probable RNA and SrmB- binding site of polymerase A
MLSLDMIAEVFEEEAAWVVGGAVRDDLLGRSALDLDVACLDPERSARALAARSGDAIFPLKQEFGAWRVLIDRSRTVDFAPLGGGSIESDLAGRDFTANAVAVPVAGGDYVDPFDGRADIGRRALRTVSASVFDDDPLRLLRGVRFEDELGFRLDPDAEELTRAKAALITRAAGERILDELLRLSAGGIERLGELGLLEPLGGHVDPRLRSFDSPWFRLAVTFGENLRRLPIPGDLRRFANVVLKGEAPADGSPRAIHRFRCATEPFALEALAYAGALELTAAVEQARMVEPDEPLLRGDELGIEPGPEVGRLLDLIAEERAAGTISTREEALELVRRSLE